MKGLKPTSSPIQISSSVTEPAPGAFVSQQIDLTLNVLDNEVFVVTQINIDIDAPDNLPLATAVQSTVSTTRRTTVGSIADQNVLGAAAREILGAPPAISAVAFDREDPLFAALEVDYLGIIATNNAFLNLVGTNNGNIKQARCRIYGFRATATASVYAALVQSELLSA